MKGKTKTYDKKWKCLICGATGKKLLNSWKANRSGRQHINNKHNRSGRIAVYKEKKLVFRT